MPEICYRLNHHISKKLRTILELPNVTLALKDGKKFKAHQVILAATNAMDDTNYGELRQLFGRQWGKQASTSTPKTARLKPFWRSS